MQKKRVVLTVVVDLDPVPGTFSTEESVVEQVQHILLQQIEHYHPLVINSDTLE